MTPRRKTVPIYLQLFTQGKCHQMEWKIKITDFKSHQR